MIAAFAATALVSCGGGAPGGPEPIVIEFQVTQVTPFNLSAGVPLTAEINVVFSKEVDPSTLTTDSLKVVAESGDEIAGDRLVAPLNRGVVRFLPKAEYFPFARHTIRVTPDVRDAEGNALDRVYEFEFQTEEAGPVLPGAAQVEDLGALLTRGRWLHRITLLPNNRFIVIGGYGANNQALAMAENLVAPLKDSFLIPDTLRIPRAAHAQVLLPDGRILVIGGEASSEPFIPLADCEVFDPVGFRFDLVAPMHFARSFAHATVLTDGRVLVTGGQSLEQSGVVFRADAEIYDPVTDTWTMAPDPMNAGRTGHFSLTLAGGDVVIVGGESGVPSSARWVRVSNSFAPNFSLPSFPHFFGAGAYLSGGRLLVASGLNSLGVTIYDPGFGFIGAVNLMPDQRAFATATAFEDGRVLIVGGLDASSFPALIHDTVDVFFPIGQSGRIFRATEIRLPEPTAYHAAALGPDGAVWITGGIPTDLNFAGLRQVTVIHPE